MVIRLYNKQYKDLWTWSNSFGIIAIGVYNFTVKTSDRAQTKFMKAIVTLENSTIFVVIEEEKPEKVALRVRNNCLGLNIRLYQENANFQEGTVVKPGMNVPGVGTSPMEKSSYTPILA